MAPPEKSTGDAQAQADAAAGAPIAKDAIDPELIKLARTRPKIGVVTAAGLVFLCAIFLWRLGSDRRFAGGAAAPVRTTVAEVVAGNVATDQLIEVDAEPMMAHAIRANTSKGSLGLRVVPVRGTGEKLWVAVSGDGWEEPSTRGYTGRLRRLADLPFAAAVQQFATEHARPLFATAAALRAGMTSNQLATVGGDQVVVGDNDRVALDVVDPGAAVIVAAFNDKLPDVVAWRAALAKADIAEPSKVDAATDQARFSITTPDALTSLTHKLEAANLWAARVESITHHYEAPWSAVRASGATGLTLGATTIPDAQVDLVGVYLSQPVPSGAYVLLAGERPTDYWYVLPITIALAAIGLVFAWALVRAVKRDLLPAAR